MSLQSVIRNPLFQYSLELVLPIIGFLFLGWTLPVIIAFYFFDLLASEITRHRRHQAVLKVNSSASQPKFVSGIVISVLSFLLLAALASFIFYQQTLSVFITVDPLNEIVEFIGSEGWILLPVVIVASVLKDKMAFYMPKKFFDYSYDKLMKNFFIEISVFFVLACLGLFAYLILAEYSIHGLVLLTGFVIVKLAFDFLLVKRLDENARS